MINKYNTVTNFYHATNHPLLKLKRKLFLSPILDNNIKKIVIGKNNLGFLRKKILVDGDHKYILNKYGYRSPEFDNAELVFAGCSHTFGMGIPEEKIWGTQLAKSLNMSYANISIPGASTQSIIQKLFGYFKEFGHPKLILCFFPDFYRMLIPTNKNTFITKNNKNPFDVNLDSIFIDKEPENDKKHKLKYAKLPFIAEELLPPELSYFISFQFIGMLEQYCRSHNIKLIWSTWSTEDEKLIRKIKNDFDVFDNYVDLNNSSLSNECLVDINCHSNIKDEYAHCFDYGADFEYKEGLRHLGVHSHTHIYEMFLNYIKEKNHETN
jgi:hypothetical protein